MPKPPCPICGRPLLGIRAEYGESGGLRAAERNDCRICGTYIITLILRHTLPTQHYDQRRRWRLSGATRNTSDTVKYFRKGPYLELATDTVARILHAFPKPEDSEARDLILRHTFRHSRRKTPVVLRPDLDYPVANADGPSQFQEFLSDMLRTELIIPTGLRPHRYLLTDKGQSRFEKAYPEDWEAYKRRTSVAAMTVRADAVASETTIRYGAEEVLHEPKSKYVRRQVERMQSSIENDPELAIGTAKEFLETVSKGILHEQSVTFSGRDDLPKLVKLALNHLDLVPGHQEAKAEELVKKLAGQLGGIAQTMAELRNNFGTGHGKLASHKGLESQHARLIVNIVSAVGAFMNDSPRKSKK